MHFSAEKSDYFRDLKTAEDNAKKQKKRIWANYVEEEVEEKREENKEETVTERKVSHEKVIVTEVTAELRFYVQHTDQGAKLENLMSKLRQDFLANPPITGSFTPKRNDLCAAKFSEDNEWYRAKIERVQGSNATILYVDYGNKEVSPSQFLDYIVLASSLDPFRSQKKWLSHKLAIVTSNKINRNYALHSPAIHCLHESVTVKTKLLQHIPLLRRLLVTTARAYAVNIFLSAIQRSGSQLAGCLNALESQSLGFVKLWTVESGWFLQTL